MTDTPPPDKNCISTEDGGCIGRNCMTEYPTVDAAVKDAIASGYATPWLIVSVIDWQAVAPRSDPTGGDAA